MKPKTADSKPKRAPEPSVVAKPAPETREIAQPAVVKPANITVMLSGGGWAHIYIDGKKSKKTAPVKGLELAPGSHKIRVLNEALGIDHTKTIRVGEGESVVVRAVPN